jgi:phytanoyl-CoA hydroxylase
LKLNDSQIEQYRECGYFVIPAAYSAEECEELCAHARDVVEGRTSIAPPSRVWIEPAAEEQGLVTEQNRWDYLFKIGHRMHMTDPVFRKYAVHANLADALEALIAPDIKCVQSMFLDKPRNLGVGQPYHQDAHYLKTDPDTLCAVWVALDDADLENGCLRVVPGSHKEPVHPHATPVDPAQRKVYVEVHSARTRPEVALPLKRGDAVIFPGHLLHRSGNNDTARRRRSYVLHYTDARSRWLNDPKAKNPFLLVRGREYPGRV